MRLLRSVLRVTVLRAATLALGACEVTGAHGDAAGGGADQGGADGNSATGGSSGLGGEPPTDAAGGTAGAPTGTTNIHRSTPAELAERSAALYEDNASGWVLASTVSRWLGNWPAERPDGIGGNLVVLQLDAAEVALPFARSGEGVRTYLASDLAELVQARSNGLVAIGEAPGRGLRIDAYLRRYRIDPTRDLVLLASGTGEAAHLSVLAKAWITLRYWGFSHEQLAVLSGGVAGELDESVRAATSQQVPVDGTVRVPTLERDHFSLLASLGEVRQASLDDQAILDVRSRSEFDGEELSGSSVDTTCLVGAPLCTAVYAGRVPGAVHLSLADLLTEDGAGLASLNAIDLALAAAGIDASEEVIVYDGDGTESAVAAFVLLGVAGIPARWYASSFAEWVRSSLRIPTKHSTPFHRAARGAPMWRRSSTFGLNPMRGFVRSFSMPTCPTPIASSQKTATTSPTHRGYRRPVAETIAPTAERVRSRRSTNSQ